MSTLLKDILQRLGDLKTVTQFRADERTVEAAKGIVAAVFANAEQEGQTCTDDRNQGWYSTLSILLTCVDGSSIESNFDLSCADPKDVDAYSLVRLIGEMGIEKAAEALKDKKRDAVFTNAEQGSSPDSPRFGAWEANRVEIGGKPHWRLLHPGGGVSMAVESEAALIEEVVLLREQLEVRAAGCQCSDKEACAFARERDEARREIERLRERQAADDAKRQAFMTNCIDRILMADCSPSKAWVRSLALTDALVIAAHQGLKEAHEHLQEIVRRAESGAYKEARER